jgi:phosphoglycolate phosphatase
MTARFRHILFDLDGTLVDSLPGIAHSVRAALTSCGLPALCPDLKPLIGPPIRGILARVSGCSEPRLLDRLERAFRSHYDAHGWQETLLQGDVPGLLKRLRDGQADSSVVTNKPSLASERILARLGLRQQFAAVVCRDSRTPPFSSKGEMIGALVSLRNLERAKCLLVGDTLEDYRAAEEAGVAVAIVAHGYGAEAVREHAPDCVFSGWDEVYQFLSEARKVSCVSSF